MIESRDLMIVFAIARAGSVGAGASKLGIHQATVFRRLDELEKSLGVRLFDRSAGRYRLTTPGEQLCKLAEHYQETMDVFQQGLRGGGLRPAGVVRVTTTDTCAGTQVTQILTDFSRLYPEIEMELIVSNQFLTLSKREADIAVRPAPVVPEHVAGRVLCAVAFALYGARDYLAERDASRPWHEHTWVAPDESLSSTTVARWLARSVPESQIRFRVNTFMGMVSAARSGVGLAALPCHVADMDPQLERASDVIPELESKLWLITHPDLRQVPRVRALLDFFPEALSQYFPLFEGKHPKTTTVPQERRRGRRVAGGKS